MAHYRVEAGLRALTLPPVLHIRRRLRSLTWIALIAMFGLALAPAVSHALARALGAASPWSDICSASATKAAGAAETPGQPANGGGLHIEHCPLCGHAGHTPVLPSASAAAFAAPVAAGFVPALFAHAPRPLFAWAAAQPRGPPNFLLS